jgi:hypothetical protein
MQNIGGAVGAVKCLGIQEPGARSQKTEARMKIGTIEIEIGIAIEIEKI